jgi:two-component system C4-dicarboxylate transport sensor histidine kinase DctB
MTRNRLHRRWIVLAFLLAVAVLGSVIWHYGYRQALDQLARRAEADLDLASDRLSTQLQVYQELAVLMAAHPGLDGLDDPEIRAKAQALLLNVADTTAALDVMYVDRTGRVLVSARGLLGPDLAGTAYFRRAMQGALGRDHGVMQPLDRRAYYYGAPAFAPDGQVRGVLVVVADVEDVEWDWRGSTPAVFFTDQGGNVFVSNRSELLFWTRAVGADGFVPVDGGQHLFAATRIGPHEIWQIDWGPYLPRRALHLTRYLAVIGLTGEVLVDVGPARRIAGLQSAMVVVICLAFGAMLYLATERRRSLAKANAVLESRVAARTLDLSQTNAALRREVAERQEAEAALQRAQADLVQAGKLSALGQMSAGISHELNQPLMAIQSFAENATQYLARGQADVAGDNLTRISDLARRMGRIIKNLRAFARQENTGAGRVELVAVLDSVIELTGARMRQEGVRLVYDRPEQPIWVRGGEVRLGQVFVNLVTNAVDAMAGSKEKVLTLEISEMLTLMVTVRDTGPGIDMPDKVFEPFYTTKEVGASEGLGLGLSISYGIVQSFGGDIRGGDAPGGGALFTVQLERWREEQAA